jgi:hypothetical protein
MFTCKFEESHGQNYNAKCIVPSHLYHSNSVGRISSPYLEAGAKAAAEATVAAIRTDLNMLK